MKPYFRMTSRGECFHRLKSEFLAIFFLALSCSPLAAKNLLDDPSFEKTKDRTRWGHVFSEWGGYIFDGKPTFEVGQVARTGNTSFEMSGVTGGKIRMYSKELTLPAGRYCLTLHLRGLDIGKVRWGSNFDLCINSTDSHAKYYSVSKPAPIFGWTPLSCVFDASDQQTFKLAFGLRETGHLWIDDASLEKVGSDIALTDKPVWGVEEEPIKTPGSLSAKPVHCESCGYRNNPAWDRCYACGHKISGGKTFAFSSPPVVVFADFENGERAPFGEGVAVKEHATSGKFSLRLDDGYTTISGKLNKSWAEHDYLRFDVYNPAKTTAKIDIEVRDSQTKGYWTRVNFSTVAPPGTSTITIPTALYVGEKSRPGRMLIRDKITRFVINIGESGPIYLDNFQLNRLDTSSLLFDELMAWDFGPKGSPLMEGFSAGSTSLNYSKGRGYGWINADWWRDFNVLQPDLLYQDFICPNQATFRINVPNGDYHVFMNIDSPGGFWGEPQIYKKRTVTANGKVVVDDDMNIDLFTKKYFRNSSREDLPGIDTFEEYVENMFNEKTFEVRVTNGTLELDFSGQDWAISLSTLVIYPDTQKAKGMKFLTWVKNRRKKQFNDYFKQVNPARTGLNKPAFGYRVFKRDFMNPAQAFDGPRKGEELKRDERIELTVARGEERPLVFAVQPSGDMGKIHLYVSPFVNMKGVTLDASSLRPGWLNYQISRVVMDGSVYTVKPRYWHPTPAASTPGVTRNFWIRVKTPLNAAPGIYRGFVKIKPEKESERSLPIQITVLPFTLDPITDVPVGPWGSGIRSKWFSDDNATRKWNREMFEKTITALREIGATSFSARPQGLAVTLANGKVKLQTAKADQQMKIIRAAGYKQMISNYGTGISGAYSLKRGISDEQAKARGFKNASDLLKKMWEAIDNHAIANDWLPVAWNLCDEPIGAAIPPTVKNAEMHAKVGNGLKRTFFMGTTSMKGNNPQDLHYSLCRTLPISSLNDHDENSIAVIKKAGGRFSFYNGGTRWTFGRYMKMLVRKHNLALRLTWHCNVVAGDPYYALDCREDDYCWFNTNAKGELVPSMLLLTKVQPGLNDYRYFSMLERLIKEKPHHPNHAAAKKLFDDMMNLKAGADRKKTVDYAADREKTTTAIISLLN